MARNWVAVAVVAAGLALTPGLAWAGSAEGSFSVGLTFLPLVPAARPVMAPRNAIYTPGAAAISVSRAGFSHIRLVERTSGIYVFAAFSEADGFAYRIAVTPWQGRIVKLARN